MASHPWIADTAQEETELWLLHSGVLPTIITNLFQAQRALRRRATRDKRCAQAFATPYGDICNGCHVCAEAPDWFIHRVIEVES